MAWEPAPGAILGGKYCLERSLAAGGMGSVWIARHTRLDAYVAVKLMSADIGQNPSSVARFEREAKACAQLQSAHVVGVHDFGVEDGTPYMVMELLRGEDLGDRIDRVGRMTPAEAVPVAVSIGKALRVAHEAGIIHRDLKPRNIFIAQQGDDEVIKLVDFGIARETKSRLVDDRTASGVVMGSPYHMSPEQAQALPVDHRTDLWALGVVLYRLVTGFRPFDGDNITSVLVTICTTPHPLPSELGADLPPALDAFFARALAKDATRRFQTAREMVDAFLVAVDGRTEPASAPHGGVPLPTPSWPSSNQAAPQASASWSGSQPAISVGSASFGGPASLGAQGGTPQGSAPITFDPRTQSPGMTDASASHALRAVSTGAQTPTPAPGGSRVVLVLGALVAAVALGAIAFYLVEATRSAHRVASESPSSSAMSALAPSAAPASAQAASVPSEAAPSAAPLVEPSAPSASASAAPVAAPSGSENPSPSASVAAAPARPAAPPRGGPRPPPPSKPTSAPAAAPAGPAIDPFTGLPVAR